MKVKRKENLLLLSQVKNSRFYNLFLAVLSGLLFWLGTPTLPFPFLSFFGFVPLLVLNEELHQADKKRQGAQFFLYTYLALIIWNLGSTWWVYYASPGGAVAAIVLNSLLMTVPLMLYRFTKKQTKPIIASCAFILYWLAFEYLHLNWDLSWPWLTLGNAFSLFPSWVQWYEYTGVLGGSLWVLFVNLQVYRHWQRNRLRTRQHVTSAGIAVLLFVGLPLVWSQVWYYTYDLPQEDGMEVVVVQPNIDPYTEKFGGYPTSMSIEEQLMKHVVLGAPKLTDQTDFLVWPETAIQGYNREETIENNGAILGLKNYLKRYPNLTLIAGLESNGPVEDQDNPPPLSNYSESRGYYDGFNSAIALVPDSVQIYHKSKLVPGVEKIPSFMIWIVEWLKFAQAGNYGVQSQRTPLISKTGLKVAPAVCYESVYGAFLAGFIENGAEILFIVTNDGWWRETDGHRQHLHFASLRAIELRRDIARSANTGVSCFINQRGDISQACAWDTENAIKTTLYPNDEITFYAEHGDYLGRLSAMFVALMFVVSVVQSVTKVKRI